VTTQLNYPGRCEGLEGQIVGPTTTGQLLCITSTFYDASRDRTEAFVRPATKPEVDAAVAAFAVPPAFRGGAA